MDRDHEHLSLSDRERSALAELEALIAAADPEFSRRLDGTPSALGRRLDGTSSARRAWVGAVLVGVGATAMLATFTTSLWLAVASAAIMAVGLVLVLAEVAAGFRRHHRNR